MLLKAARRKHLERQLGHFLDCVSTSRRPLTDARRSRQSLRVIWKLCDAEERGVVVDLRGLGMEQV